MKHEENDRYCSKEEANSTLNRTGEQLEAVGAVTRHPVLLAFKLCAAVAVFVVSTAAQQPPLTFNSITHATEATARSHYRINWTLDFDGRSYSGVERVRWINRGERSASVLYFHLYANMGAGAPASEAPRLEVSEVRDPASNEALSFSLDDQATILRVNLRGGVAAGAAAGIEIKFKGSVPKTSVEQTSLFAHIVQQVGAALRSEREMRHPRDVNFRCRGLMLLGTAYPVLAARDGDDWQRKVELTIGDTVFTETADYHVTIDAPSDVMVFASGTSAGNVARGTRTIHEFEGENLRDFAIVAGHALKSEERMVGDVNVRSIFIPEHEAVGRRVLAAAADAVRVYVARFGPLPYKTVSIVDAPLSAGLGSTEFSGLGAIASAFYVDFDAPQMHNLPEIIREQRASIEESLEWTVAHVVAHQWWGAAVGNDPSRQPFLDEALANWSALLYYTDIHGEERAAAAMEDQLRGVYKVYRTFGGEDMAADRAARDYRNSFQYAAIVGSKGALMFAALRRLMEDERFFAALRSYYKANKFEIAEMDDLRGAFLAESAIAQRRAVARTFNRWLSSKHGDEDIAPPDPKLAATLGINPAPPKSNDRNAFARLGKFFWQQMTRIR